MAGGMEIKASGSAGGTGMKARGWRGTEMKGGGSEEGTGIQARGSGEAWRGGVGAPRGMGRVSRAEAKTGAECRSPEVPESPAAPG